MKKTLYISSFLLLLVCPLLQSANSIQFANDSWDSILDQARIEQKPIFVKAYADYCMPCKLMDKTVFVDKNVINVFNDQFINFKVDMQTPLADVFNVAYGVKMLPSLLFFDENGNVVQILEGTLTVDELLNVAQSYSYINQTVVVETETIAKASPEQMEIPSSNFSYMEEASRIDRKVNQLKNQMYSNNTLVELFEMASIMKAEAVDILVKKPSLFIQKFGKAPYYNKIKESGDLATKMAVEYNDAKLIDKAIKILKQSKHPNTNQLSFEWQVAYYAGINDWNTYTEIHYKYRNKISKKTLRLAMEKVSTKSISTKSLKKAYKMAKSDLHHTRLQSIFNHKLK